MKNFVCVFAHPDDEAFGPSGTIAKLVQKYNVYILCATKGEAGLDSNAADSTKIHERRAAELLESAKVLDVKKVYFLGFKDGRLCNSSYHTLAEKIQKKLELLRPVGIMTFEPRGISGHIDHIVVSLATTFVFQKLSFVHTLMYYCVTREWAAATKNYFIYFPPGYKKNEIDKTIDVSDVWDTKIRAMMCHKSQLHDAERILKQFEAFPKEENFLLMKQDQQVTVEIIL